jgi:HlyD family secretion protein
MAVIAVAAGAVTLSLRSEPGTPASPPSAPGVTSVRRVSSLGRIQPEDRTIVLGARSLSGQPSIIGELLVKEGDDVEAGEVVAILNSRKELEATSRQAEARIKVAESRRNQVMAGAKAADVAAQQEEVKRLEIELANAQAEHARTDRLYKASAVSTSAWEQSRLRVDSTTRLVEAARARLRSLTEIRQSDIQVAEAELEAARADAVRARAASEAAEVRAPYSGRVVKIHTWQGEEVKSSGVAELARLDRMFVIAEVAESDISRVRVGQRARITGDSLPKQLGGRVEQVGLKVSRNSLMPGDPVSLTDARVVEVKLLLDDSASVKGLIGAQVEVLIDP